MQDAVVFQSHLYGIERFRTRRKLQKKACFNRTFMELKAEGVEPSQRAVPGFNRTFMELKEFLNGITELLQYCFNRTFMELKERLDWFDRHRSCSFNRTFMELKEGESERGEKRDEVSIAPLWN